MIATDIEDLEHFAPLGTTVHSFSRRQYPSSLGKRLRLLRAALDSDHLVIDFSLPDVLWLTAALALLPFHRCRITTLDFFVGNQHGWRLKLTAWSLRRVDRFLVYFKNSSFFQHQFSLPAERFHYIPFKIDALELIQGAKPRDSEYIFCGGRSRRDFATLFRAVEQLDYPVRVVTSPRDKMELVGSTIDGLSIPPNVEIYTSDQSPSFFVETMAAARLVVIPLVKGSHTQAGIAVYLQAMALGKCVIISKGLGVDDVLSGNEAIIVPPGDVAALQNAIRLAWNNAALRSHYASSGLAYAHSLGGTQELCRSILGSLPSLSGQG